MNKEVVNCEFSFKCPKDWNSLVQTPFKDIRFCGQCSKPVFFCRESAQVQWAGDNRQCAAALVPYGEIETEIVMGDVSPPEK